MTKLIDSTIQSVRRISTELRPGVLDDLGLAPAIEWQAQEFQARAGIQCVFISHLEDVDVPRSYATAVFRIFQEALINVARHANATKVCITLRKNMGHLFLEVRDNGKGITKDAVSDAKSLGLLGMRERALPFGGAVDIKGIQGKGTTVTVRIPIGQHRPEARNSSHRRPPFPLHTASKPNSSILSV